jgi:hypothetical protein
MKESEIHSMVVLHYLRLGIVPYYPGSGVLIKPDRKTRRKFRKVWRKAARELDMIEKLSSKNETPSQNLKGYRQSIVYSWIRNKIVKKSN